VGKNGQSQIQNFKIHTVVGCLQVGKKWVKNTEFNTNKLKPNWLDKSCYSITSQLLTSLHKNNLTVFIKAHKNEVQNDSAVCLKNIQVKKAGPYLKKPIVNFLI